VRHGASLGPIKQADRRSDRDEDGERHHAEGAGDVAKGGAECVIEKKPRATKLSLLATAKLPESYAIMLLSKRASRHRARPHE
jgi:hypothetical protein